MHQLHELIPLQNPVCQTPPPTNDAKSKPARPFRQIVRTHLRHSRRSLSLAILSMLGVTLTEMLNPWPLKLIFDQILLNQPLPPALAFLAPFFTDQKILALLVMAGVMATLALLGSLFAYTQTYLTSRISFELIYTLRVTLFAHLQRLSLSFHNRTRSGEILTRITSDTNTLKEVFTESALTFAREVLTFIGMFIIMFWMNWQLTLVVLITFPVLYVTFHRLQKQLRQVAQTQRKKEGKIAGQIAEILMAIPTVQAFGREEYETRRFESENARNLDESIRLARLDAAVSRSVTIIRAVGISSVVILGAWQALYGHMSPGDVLIFVSYARSLYKPIGKMAKILTKFAKASISARRIEELLAIEPDIQDAPDAVEVTQLRGEIVFRNVSFRYDRHHPALRNISFTIRPGERVALVGASGAGKSTIVSLLLRLYDVQAGKILIDGRPVQSYKRHDLRRQVGLVLQDATLFGTTIRENISYGKPDATDAEIEWAARQAQAHDFIMALPKGYDTVIGERGATLSGGQKQRLAIARALVKRPSLFIFDEPTSALDAESSALVTDTLAHLQRGKTLLMIAHDLTHVRNFDQILVLKDGRIVERGTHKTLMAQRGYYYELYQLQHHKTETQTPAKQTIPPPLAWSMRT